MECPGPGPGKRLENNWESKRKTLGNFLGMYWESDRKVPGKFQKSTEGTSI